MDKHQLCTNVGVSYICIKDELTAILWKPPHMWLDHMPQLFVVVCIMLFDW